MNFEINKAARKEYVAAMESHCGASPLCGAAWAPSGYYHEGTFGVGRCKNTDCFVCYTVWGYLWGEKSLKNASPRVLEWLREKRLLIEAPVAETAP